MNIERDKLVEFVSEDVAMFLATKENPEALTEEEMLAWQSGYIAGYNRAGFVETNKEESN